jgi:glycosyltransferase involved in cell wall biosynthesis
MAEGGPVSRLLLSVVVPWRDDPRILELLESLREDEDSAANVELILVNDASDATKLVGRVEQVVAGLPSARIVTSSAKCVGAARNSGFRESSAPFVCFLDSDDRPQWRALTAMARQAGETGLDVIIGQYKVERDGSQTEVLSAAAVNQLSPMASALVYAGAVWRYVFRREFLVSSSLEFPEWNYAEDVVFLLEVLAANPRQGVCPEVAYVYCEHDSGRRLTRASRATGEFTRSAEGLSAVSAKHGDHEVSSVAELWRARVWAHALRTLPVSEKFIFLRTARFPNATALGRSAQHWLSARRAVPGKIVRGTRRDV